MWGFNKDYHDLVRISPNPYPRGTFPFILSSLDYREMVRLQSVVFLYVKT